MCGFVDREKSLSYLGHVEMCAAPVYSKGRSVSQSVSFVPTEVINKRTSCFISVYNNHLKQVI